MPYVEGAIDMIKKLKNDLNADIIIISDANSIYIQESLVNIGLRWEKLSYLWKQVKFLTPTLRSLLNEPTRLIPMVWY